MDVTAANSSPFDRDVLRLLDSLEPHRLNVRCQTNFLGLGPVK